MCEISLWLVVFIVLLHLPFNASFKLYNNNDISLTRKAIYSTSSSSSSFYMKAKDNYAISLPHWNTGQIRNRRSRGGRGWQKQQKLVKDKGDKDDNNFRRVAVYCVGDKIDLLALRAYLFRNSFSEIDNNIDNNNNLQLDYTDTAEDEVLHIKNNVNINDNDNEDNNDNNDASILFQMKDIFYFDYGVVVFWNLDPLEETTALQELKTFISDPVKPNDFTSGYDELKFSYDRKIKKNVKFDCVNIRSLKMEEKLAYSYAIAQSSKLFIFENKVQRRLNQTRNFPRELAATGKIKIGKTELNSLIGSLFVEQTEVNLFSTILDTPDFLWDDDDINTSPAYESLRNYLEVDDRVTILNTRLDVIKELLNVLTSQLSERQSSRLEWIIIWLISIEIVMGLLASPLILSYQLPKRMLFSFAVPAGLLLYRKFEDN